MAKSYLLNTPGSPETQGERSSGRTDEIKNSDGAYVFSVDDRERVERFLILGSEGGSYYASEAKLTGENASTTLRYIRAHGLDAVKLIEDISVSGRAVKNDPALFVLAMALSYGDIETRAAAASALPSVARTGTHLFHFAAFVNSMRGWGKGLRKAISNWYTGMGTDALAYQVVKYSQRDGWSHRDLLRLAHIQAKEQGGGIGGAGVPGSVSENHNTLFKYIVDGWESVGPEPHPEKDLQIVWAAERAKDDISEADLLNLIEIYRLPMEAIPTQKRSAAIYEHMLLYGGSGLTFVLRNLGNLTKHGVLATGQYNEALKQTLGMLSSAETLKKGRLHPLSILMALRTYQAGVGVRGTSRWQPVQDIVDALNDAFYLSFDTIMPSGARFVLGIDVSGSMTMGTISGMTGITPNIGAATMAMVTKRTEPYAAVMGFAQQFVDLQIGKNDSLETVMRKTQDASFGSTDCARPMTWATENRVEADAFVVYTDSDTNTFNSPKPYIALEEYRQKMGIDAKLITVGMVANSYSIADPVDVKRQLNVVGFDTSAPGVISEFARPARS